MSITDAHVHIYPDAIASRAVQSVADFYTIDGTGNSNGSVGDLLKATEGTDIDRYIVCSVAVKPKTVVSINDFLAKACSNHPEFTGFMALHQDFEDPEKEIERAQAMGLKGIKLHPDTQMVNADDPRLMDIYAIAEEKNLPIIIHAGDYRYEYSHPERIREVLRAFPNLVVNAAHFGGWSIFDLAADYLRDERCFVDMSSSIMFMGKRHARELIDLYGTHRVMFGTDYPMWDPALEAKALGELGLDDDAYQRIARLNAEAFLGLS